MKFTIERNWVDVVGKGWYGQDISYTYKLGHHEMENIGEPTRANVEAWLGSHAGDFQSIEDFHAVVGEVKIPWQTEDAEMAFSDMMFPAVD